MSDTRESTNYIYADENGTKFADDFFYSMTKNSWDILNSSSINTYIVNGNEPSTLPYLAEKFYSNIDYWWIIGMFNGIDNILAPIPKNTIIFYPSDEDISSYFKGSSQIQSTSEYKSEKSVKYINGSFTF